MSPLSDSERKRWMDFAYGEYVRRRENGEWIEIEEYCQLFPQIAHSLRELIAADHFLRLRLDFLGSALPEDWPQAGEQFLGYELLRELGQGGFSRVYLAHDSSGKSVVAKVTEEGDQEALILQQFQHPNIIEVLDVKQCLRRNAEFTAIIMPYHGCATLNDILNHRRRQSITPLTAQWLIDSVVQHEAQWATTYTLEDNPISEGPSESSLFSPDIPWEHCVVKLGVEIADALHYVHQKGLLHRDIKPANILITAEGKPILLDFNLAWKIKELDDSIGGTMPYMAPEQLTVLQYEFTQGKKGEIRCGDARSEICSLGIVLFELFTGVHPYFQKNMSSVDREQLRALHGSQMQSNRPVAEGASDEFQVILNRCLARNPYHRFATAAELAQALRDLTEPKQPRQFFTRRRIKALAYSLSVALLFLLTLSILQKNSPEQSNVYTQAELHYLRGLELSKKQRPLEALKHYRLAQDHVFHRRLHARIGICMIQAGYFKAGEKYHQFAMDAGLQNAAILNNQGYALLRLGKLDQAKVMLTKAIQLDSKLIPPYQNRAEVDLVKAFRNRNYLPIQGVKDIELALASHNHRRTARIAFQLFRVMSQREQHRAEYWRNRLQQLRKRYPNCAKSVMKINHFIALLDPFPDEVP